jgi:hypothetical protein
MDDDFGRHDEFGRHVDEGAAPVPEHARRAALALHAMTPVDRAWILEHLPEARRITLERLLDEIAALGLPVQPQHVRALCEPGAALGALSLTLGKLPASVAGTARFASSAPGVDPLHALSAAVAHRVLAAEPDRLIADALRLGPFPWQAGLLDLLGDRRPAVVAMLQDSVDALPARRAGALRLRLAERARTLIEGDRPQQVQSSRAGRLALAWAARLLGIARMPATRASAHTTDGGAR